MPAANAVEVLARDWQVDINTGSDVSTVWTEVKGLDTLTFSGTDCKADTTTFDDEGMQSHVVASRTKSLVLRGKYQVDPSDGARDPGQAAVDDLAEAVGSASLRLFRVTDPGGSTESFKASVTLGDIGGGNDDPTGWSVTLLRSGASTRTHPEG